MRVLTVLAGLLVLFAVPAAGQGPRASMPQSIPVAAPAESLTATATLHPRRARIGERLALRIALPRPAGGGRLLGPPAPASLGDIDVLASEEAPAGVDSVAWSLTAAVFGLGEQDLAAIPFRWERGGRAVAIRLPSLPITVEPVLTDSAAADSLRPIRGPVPVPMRWRGERVALALAVLAALAAAVVLWRRRRRVEPVPVEPLIPALPPEVEALAALRDLEREALPARGQTKEHYARLSLILRTYMERRWLFPAVESTTHEIRRTLIGAGPAVDVGDGILDLFEEADLVKFAKLDPGPVASRDALSRGRDWVERTTPARAAGGA
jgi:hypothetical protein